MNDVFYWINKEERMVFRNGENTSGNLNEPTIYLGKNVRLKGDLHFEGSGRIDGRVEGKIIVKGTLTLGEEGMISSEIEGDTVIIGGKVEGKIVGRQKVQLMKTAVVNADVTTPCVSIEEGAQLNGSCKMGGDQHSVTHLVRSDKTHATLAAS
jgi:cytoskeletal protein CcmA (bactofilin family)